LGGLWERAVLLIHEGHNFLQEEFGVAVGAAAAKLWDFCGRVFVDAGFAGVVDADDDERFDCAALDQVVGGALDVPVLPSEGGGTIEKILAVLEVEDGKSTPGLLVVAGWDVDDQVALIAQES
jgi:hypothetical protein